MLSLSRSTSLFHVALKAARRSRIREHEVVPFAPADSAHPGHERSPERLELRRYFARTLEPLDFDQEPVELHGAQSHHLVVQAATDDEQARTVDRRARVAHDEIPFAVSASRGVEVANGGSERPDLRGQRLRSRALCALADRRAPLARSRRWSRTGYRDLVWARRSAGSINAASTRRPRGE
jgi:hypothetical protein